MLKDHILVQSKDYSYSYGIICDQHKNKANISKENSERCKEEADRICAKLPPNLQKTMILAMEKGASTWLTVFPLAEHRFTLHKSAFQEALALCSGWSPSKCECEHVFSVDHAFSCAKGGFSAHRHNKIAYRSVQRCTCGTRPTTSCTQPTRRLTHRIVQGWIYQQMGYGVEDMNRLF